MLIIQFLLLLLSAIKLQRIYSVNKKEITFNTAGFPVFNVSKPTWLLENFPVKP